MKLKVIVADDVKMNRRLIVDVLKQKLTDIDFIEAKDGLEVLAYVEAFEVDLIILDLVMPRMDGFEVLKALKSVDKTMDIPIIVNSAITDIKSIENTLKEGAMDYFTKPLSGNDLEIILPLKAQNAINYYEQKKMINHLNKALYEELKNANTFQKIMLPKSSEFGNIDLFLKYQPSLGIGGDLFDCFEKDGQVWFMIADVTGHGIAAGMASSMVKILFRSTVKHHEFTPDQVMGHINEQIFEIFNLGPMDNYFCFTAFVGCIDHNELTYANGSQPPPLLVNTMEKSIEALGEGGMSIGMFDFASFDMQKKHLESGDFLVLYTDGLFSSGVKGDFLNWTQVEDFAKMNLALLYQSPKEFIDEMFYYFHLIHRKSHDDEVDFTDDVAIIILKLK